MTANPYLAPLCQMWNATQKCHKPLGLTLSIVAGQRADMGRVSMSVCVRFNSCSLKGLCIAYLTALHIQCGRRSGRPQWSAFRESPV
jgi:hypothetical protein